MRIYVYKREAAHHASQPGISSIWGIIYIAPLRYGQNSNGRTAAVNSGDLQVTGVSYPYPIYQLNRCIHTGYSEGGGREQQ